jgi:hypothetical protein
VEGERLSSGLTQSIQTQVGVEVGQVKQEIQSSQLMVGTEGISLSLHNCGEIRLAGLEAGGKAEHGILKFTLTIHSYQKVGEASQIQHVELEVQHPVFLTLVEVAEELITAMAEC